MQGCYVCVHCFAFHKQNLLKQFLFHAINSEINELQKKKTCAILGINLKLACFKLSMELFGASEPNKRLFCEQN